MDLGNSLQLFWESGGNRLTSEKTNDWGQSKIPERAQISIY